MSREKKPLLCRLGLHSWGDIIPHRRGSLARFCGWGGYQECQKCGRHHDIATRYMPEEDAK